MDQANDADALKFEDFLNASLKYKHYSDGQAALSEYKEIASRILFASVKKLIEANGLLPEEVEAGIVVRCARSIERGHFIEKATIIIIDPVNQSEVNVFAAETIDGKLMTGKVWIEPTNKASKIFRAIKEAADAC